MKGKQRRLEKIIFLCVSCYGQISDRCIEERTYSGLRKRARTRREKERKGVSRRREKWVLERAKKWRRLKCTLSTETKRGYEKLSYIENLKAPQIENIKKQ